MAMYGNNWNQKRFFSSPQYSLQVFEVSVPSLQSVLIFVLGLIPQKSTQKTINTCIKCKTTAKQINDYKNRLNLMYH